MTEWLLKSTFKEISEDLCGLHLFMLSLCLGLSLVSDLQKLSNDTGFFLNSYMSFF